MQFRRSHSRTPPAKTPASVVPIAIGDSMVLHIPHVFPRVKCFVQVDLECLVIRWTRQSFISLYSVVEVDQTGHRESFVSSTSHRTNRDGASLATRPAETGNPAGSVIDGDLGRSIEISFRDRGGVERVLELSEPSKTSPGAWIKALRSLLQMLPCASAQTRLAMSVHWRWALSCMASASARGSTGFLRHAELRWLLRRANVNTQLTLHEIEAALEDVYASERKMAVTRELPPWLQELAQGNRRKLLSAWQVTGLMLQLRTSSPHIEGLYLHHSINDQIGIVEWLNFVRTEQLSVNSTQVGGSVVCGASAQPSGACGNREGLSAKQEQELIQAQQHLPQAFENWGTGLSRMQFSLELLNPSNDAVGPPVPQGTTGSLRNPLADYWSATSHNSYIVGDQITGRSSADAYRRQLLQGLRQVEVDCWDGPNPRKPLVKHGNTFCTVATFDDVAKAIGEHAFRTSDLPLSLSLEMHCSPRQQRSLTDMMIVHFGDSLLSYDELVGFGRAAMLSPADLTYRVLAKGKTKARGSVTPKGKRIFSMRRSLSSYKLVLKHIEAAEMSPPAKTSRMCYFRSGYRFFHDSARLSRGSGCSPTDLKGLKSSQAPTLAARPAESVRHVISRRHSEIDDALKSALVQDRKSTAGKIHKGQDDFYCGYLSIRSVPLAAFIQGGPHPWPLSMTSINEHTLLKELGLSHTERNQIEGISSISVRGGLGLTEDQLASRTIVRLAHDPPQEVGIMQRRAAISLLRPFPLGLRFSGKNMSPLPGWLSGGHCVALNFSDVDLAVQLHFALFNGSGGYIAKPSDMQGHAFEEERSRRNGDDDFRWRDAYWPPPRGKLHRTTISLLSLHCLPKRKERRPCYDGSRRACHGFLPELSGTSAPADNLETSSPQISLSLHPIGGFCTISDKLPLPLRVESEFTTATAVGNGMNAAFGDVVHCVAAEPQATFLRVSVIDAGQEVCYEICVLGRLKHGFRVLQMRSLLGTRIELCVLFVQIIFGSGERNQWQTARQLRLKEDIGDEFEALKGEVGHLRASLACRTSTCSSAGDGVDSTSLGYAPNGYGFKAVGDTFLHV